MKLKSISFEDKIIIYWCYENYVFNEEHSFFLNDKEIGKNKKTHFTFENLKPDTKYKIIIKKAENVIATKIIKTLPKRECISVPTSLGKGKLCTNELQNLINNAENKTLLFKKGIYLTGALFVKSNTHIKLEKEALIQGSEFPKDYLPMIPSRFEGLTMNCYASLFNIGECNPKKGYKNANIYIYGDGSIIGGGPNLCHAIIDEQIKNVDASIYDSKVTNANVLAGRYRGRLIQINNSKNVVIEGLKLGYSPSWNIHPIYSKNIVVTNCLIKSDHLHNGDGIDPDSTINMDIFNVEFATGDDCVAIKSGKNPDGNKIHRSSKNINVFDCKSSMGHGCCIGSEMSGGISDVHFFDCDFEKTRFGVQIKTTKKRGGYVKNVVVEDLKLPAINCRTVTYNDEGESIGKLATFNNFKFKNIYLSGFDVGNFGDEKNQCNHIEIKGFEENKKAFSNIILENIKYNGKKRVVVSNSTNVKEI